MNNLSLIFSVVVAFILSTVRASDCDDFKAFFNGFGYNLECCDNVYILCDGDSIKSITLDASNMNQYPTPISFDNFPLFNKLKHLIITDNVESLADTFQGNLPSRFFELPNLEVLEITRSKIRSIPNTVNSKSNISEIRLNHNNITTFPYQFKDLPKLTELYISNNQLSGSLETNIKDFSNLKTLDCGSNLFNGEINLPDSLEVFNANNNEFRSVSPNNSYKSLKDFKVLNNNIDDTVIQEITKARNLVSLIIGGNAEVKNLPDDIYRLNNLKNLDISSTSIESLPNNLFSLTDLDYFNIRNNPQLHPTMVRFGNPINVCQFENTDLGCYQEGTCNFVFGFHKYRDCYDYEIEQMHNVKSEVTDYVQVESKTKKVLRYLVTAIVGVVCLVVGCILGCCLRGRKSGPPEKKREADVLISPIVSTPNKSQDPLLPANGNQSFSTNVSNNNNNNTSNINGSASPMNSSFANISLPNGHNSFVPATTAYPNGMNYNTMTFPNSPLQTPNTNMLNYPVSPIQYPNSPVQSTGTRVNSGDDDSIELNVKLPSIRI